MRTNAVDLRRKMKDILSAVERNEPVTVLYHGKEKAVIMPITSEQAPAIESHPFFGMLDDDKSVKSIIDDLRAVRYS